MVKCVYGECMSIRFELLYKTFVCARCHTTPSFPRNPEDYNKRRWTTTYREHNMVPYIRRLFGRHTMKENYILRNIPVAYTYIVKGIWRDGLKNFYTQHIKSHLHCISFLILINTQDSINYYRFQTKRRPHTHAQLLCMYMYIYV